MGKHIHYKKHSYQLNENESVLDCLLREHENIPHSCKSGVCQSCLMQASSGEVPEKAQAGLKHTFKQRKLFLACQCYPANDLTIKSPDEAGIDVKCKIIEKSDLNHNVIKVCLKPSEPFESEPGQYLTLINPDQTARSYSVANNPMKEGFIELHIRLLADGLMSNWLKDSAAVGNEVVVRGPAGNCFYSTDGDNNFPIILAGTGTGLAPLYGILNEALHQKHEGEIMLFHGALREADLYLVSELMAIAGAHKNVTYSPCVLGGEPEKFYLTGNIQDLVMDAIPADKKEATHLFLCGAPEMVNPLKTKAFLAGLSSKCIFADPFLPSKL